MTTGHLYQVFITQIESGGVVMAVRVAQGTVSKHFNCLVQVIPMAL